MSMSEIRWRRGLPDGVSLEMVNNEFKTASRNAGDFVFYLDESEEKAMVALNPSSGDPLDINEPMILFESIKSIMSRNLKS